MPELRELFDLAVADPPPERYAPADVLRAARQQGRRRRTWLVAGGAAAAVALVLGAVWVAGVFGADPQPSPAPQPTPSMTPSMTPSRNGSVPLTNGALAALVVSHLRTTPTAVAKNESPSFPSGTVATEVGLGEVGGGAGGSVVAVASPGSLDEAFPCDVMDGCVEVDTDAGPVRLAWREETPEEDPGYVVVVAHRSGEGQAVGWGGDRITGDPRELDLQVGVDLLVEIVTDPRFGMTTTAELAAAGVEYFPGEAPSPTTSAPGPEPMTSGALAVLASETIPETPSGVRDYSADLDHQGPAVLLRYGEGRRLVLGVVPGRMPLDPCRTADRCIDAGGGDGVRLGWEVDLPGEPGFVVFEQYDGEQTRFVLWQQPGIDGDPRGGPLEARLNQLLRLLQDPRFGLLTDPALVAAAPELPPTDDTSGG